MSVPAAASAFAGNAAAAAAPVSTECDQASATCHCESAELRAALACQAGLLRPRQVAYLERCGASLPGATSVWLSRERTARLTLQASERLHKSRRRGTPGRGPQRSTLRPAPAEPFASALLPGTKSENGGSDLFVFFLCPRTGRVPSSIMACPPCSLQSL